MTIRERDCYLHKGSVDPKSKKTKSKYKLCSMILEELGGWTLYVSTSKNHYPPKYTITLTHSEWIRVEPSLLPGVSHFCPINIEVMGSRIAERKLRSGFLVFAGEMPAVKYRKLMDLSVKFNNNEVDKGRHNPDRDILLSNWDSNAFADEYDLA